MSINIQYLKQFSKEYKDFIIVLSKLSELKNIKNLPFDVDTLEASKAFDETTKLFDPPKEFNKHIKKFLSDKEIKEIAEELKNN